MDLQTLWFSLIAVLYVGYFVLEGFDMGVGILLPFLGKDETRRRMMINTIGPHWDGNEVWLLTAGGATFAAFPRWYASLFSGFYLALFLMLVALIVRGVAFEFRSKDDNPRWRATWDWAIFLGSLVPALLWGVAFGNFVHGVAIDAHQNIVGSFFDLLNPYALVAGLASVAVFTLHGAIFLTLKTADPVSSEARRLAWPIWIGSVVLGTAYAVFTYFATDILSRLGVNPGPVPIGAIIALLLSGYFIRIKRDGWAFGMTAVTILLTVATIFLTLYPRVLVSSLNPEWSLTIQNTSSSPYTLQIMTIVALIFVPIVLVYQGWTYWVFRKRISQNPEDLHY
jgi:cytochrome bd ubiquinol oxidase subunit II